MQATVHGVAKSRARLSDFTFHNNPRNAWIGTRVWSQMVKYRICFEGRVNRTCAMMEYEENGRNSNDIKLSVSSSQKMGLITEMRTGRKTLVGSEGEFSF